MADATRPTPEPEPGPVGRPFGQLHDFPVEVRWELTRRHPYYLVFWADALEYRRRPPGDRSDEALLDFAAFLMLGSIGMTGEPVAPGTEFAALIEGDPDPAFLSGSVQPITSRALVAMLLQALPPDERREVGLLFLAADDEEFAVEGDDAERGMQRQMILGQLAKLASPALDSSVNVPLFFIHMGASQRSIASDVADQVRRWKGRLGLGSSKVHKGSLDDYLEVWDLREGWTGGGYDRTRELTFSEIGRQLGIRSTSTVANRYRSAFEMITGHGFRPDLWWRLFGPLKLSVVLGGPAASLAAPTLRHLRPRTRRPVPDSKLGPQGDRGQEVGFSEGKSAFQDDLEFRDLVIDIGDLIDRGHSDGEIAHELDLKDAEAVAYFRRRRGEFGPA